MHSVLRKPVGMNLHSPFSVSVPLCSGLRFLGREIKVTYSASCSDGYSQGFWEQGGRHPLLQERVRGPGMVLRGFKGVWFIHSTVIFVKTLC